MKPQLSLSSFSLKNFRAVQDSKSIKFTPLTVFIGNNGSGKSSIVEAMEILQTFALKDIDSAMQPWHGFEHIWNKTKKHNLRGGRVLNPLTCIISGKNHNEWIKPKIKVVSHD